MSKPVFPGLQDRLKLPTPDDVFDKPEREKIEKGQLKAKEYFRLFVARLKTIPNGGDLVRSHLKLVPRIAASMRKRPIYGLEPWWDNFTGRDKKDAARGYGIVWEELTSAGFVGLMESLKRFDPSRGAFSTCADDNIKKAIRAEIRFLYQPVKKAGWSTSLTIEVDDQDEDSDDGCETLVVDDYYDETLLQRLELECRIAACTTLTPIERRIVEARLVEDFPTLRELAADIDKSHQRVHQLEEAAFKKIAATELPPSDLVRFYIPNHTNRDDWLDAITLNFYAELQTWLVTRLQLFMMHWLAEFGREDRPPRPLRECEPEIKERFRVSDKLLTRCFIVTPDGVAQHNRWTAPSHHKEYAKWKKELWRPSVKNPLWRPLSYPCHRVKEAITASVKCTPFWVRPWIPFRENRMTIWVKPPPGFVSRRKPLKAKASKYESRLDFLLNATNDEYRSSKLGRFPRKTLEPLNDPLWPNLLRTEPNARPQRRQSASEYEDASAAC